MFLFTSATNGSVVAEVSFHVEYDHVMLRYRWLMAGKTTNSNTFQSSRAANVEEAQEMHRCLGHKNSHDNKAVKTRWIQSISSSAERITIAFQVTEKNLENLQRQALRWRVL
ncbi:hypothetical protein KIN20_033947 [Parelaphostrongylus tenuis]|uniref:Uncharacterized protein n=1 Tax=Parelaphostrongylus tenuis TaxID=148309 RepID=A0AAD5R9L1_PARTN|nr:hypothetical protein KIN20_033947 [Parelaphostrongylus tenuis]